MDINMTIKSTIKIKEEINKISVEYIEKELNIDSIWKNIIYVDRNLVFTPGKK